MLFWDVDYSQEKKTGQNVCGDVFHSKRFFEEGRLISVLSDGLGSGVKANILASMTATMALKFVSSHRSISKASEVIMDALPVCQVRKIGYATFSIVDCNQEGKVQIIEEGNPQFFLCRDQDVLSVTGESFDSQKWKDRSIKIYSLTLNEGDRIVFCSDGVTQSGLGNKNKFKLGWKREGVAEFLKKYLSQNPTASSRKLAQEVIKEAMLKEPELLAKDDMTCSVFHYRGRRSLLVFSGPPYNQERDNEYAREFDKFSGRKAICGGTTANMIARELRKTIQLDLSTNRSYLPAYSRMKGVDLVTEGVLTLTQAIKYLEANLITYPNDAAGKLVELFLDSDQIEFMIGVRINEAHLDPTIPVELDFRKNLIKKMSTLLKEKYFKEVSVRYI